jgi:hypothetical protein
VEASRAGADWLGSRALSVNVTLVDILGNEVFEADLAPIGPRASSIALSPVLRPLSCVVDVQAGQDASLIRVVLVIADGNGNVTSLVQAR